MSVMASKLFEPKGEKAEWEMLYDYLRPLKQGDLVTYKQMSSILGKDIRKSRTAIYRAMKKLEEKDNRSLLCVLRTGYRITIAQEHEELAGKHHKRARRQLNRAISKISSADRTQLTREDRQRFDSMELALRQQQDMIKRLNDRVAVVEEKQNAQNDMSEKISKMVEALKRHGIEIQ